METYLKLKTIDNHLFLYIDDYGEGFSISKKYEITKNRHLFEFNGIDHIDIHVFVSNKYNNMIDIQIKCFPFSSLDYDDIELSNVSLKDFEYEKLLFRKDGKGNA